MHQVFLGLLSAEITMPDVPVAYVYRAVRNAALNARRSGLRLAEFDPQSSVFRHREGNQEAALALEKQLRTTVETTPSQNRLLSHSTCSQAPRATPLCGLPLPRSQVSQMEPYIEP